MANVVYGDPFGSYVKGQEQGQKQAIELGEAQRKFRDSDVSADYKKWYLPHLQSEVQAQLYQEQMKAWQTHAQNLWGAAQSGDKRAISQFEDFFQQSYGWRPNLTRPTPEQSAWIIGAISGGVPGAATNPEVGQAGPHGVVMYRNPGGGGGSGGGVDPWRQLNSDWGQGGTGQGGQGQTGDIHSLPNLLGSPSPYNPAPIQPDNSGAGIPAGSVNPQAYPSVSSMPGDEQGGEMNTTGGELPHFQYGSADQNAMRMAGQGDPSDFNFVNPQETGRMAPNKPMGTSEVSFNPPTSNMYPPAGQFPNPINLTPYKAPRTDNAPTPKKQIWADDAEKQFRINQQINENRSARPAAGGVF